MFRAVIRSVVVSAAVLCVMGISATCRADYSSAAPNVTATREFDMLTAGVSELVTVTFQLTNTEGKNIKGFYYADNIPTGLSVSAPVVKVDGIDVSYTYETGQVGEVYTNCRTHRWIVETPPSYPQVTPVGASVRIEYKVLADSGGSYAFPNYNWAGTIVDGGVGSVFGYDDGEVPVLEVSGAEGEGEGEGEGPTVSGVPQSTWLGTAMLVSLLALAAVLSRRSTV